MKRLLFAVLSAVLWILPYSCIEYPAMTDEVIGAGVPAFEGLTEVLEKKATTIKVRAVVSKENGDKITERGFLYGLTSPPTAENNGTKIPHSAIGIGDYDLTIEGLANHTRYFILPYAENAKGIGYGTELEEWTNDGNAYIATLKTNENEVRCSSAKAGGRIESTGEGFIDKLGVILYKIDDISSIDTIYYDTIYPLSAKGGETFICSLTGLTPDTWYYVQAFVSNAFSTIYGSRDSLKTLDGIPEIVETSIREQGYTHVTLEASVTNGGDETVVIAECGFYWSDDPNDMLYLSDNVERCENNEGNFVGTISNLTPDKAYYARAYAISDLGIVGYGEKQLLKTELDLPTVSTDDINNSSIMGGGADVGGTILIEGMYPVTASGICWSSSHNVPNINDSILSLTAGPNGEFSGRLSRLKGSTRYYVRAYATNSQGGTGYGEVKQFTTPPVFTTNLANFPGAMRTTNSMAYFAIDRHLYMLGGDLGDGFSFTSELWRYSIERNVWETRLAFIGGPMKWQTGVTYGFSAFVYGGYNRMGDEKPGIYQYNSYDNLWYYLNGPNSAIVNQAIGYSYSNSIYYIGGLSDGMARQDVWRYEPPQQLWEQKTNFPVKQYGGIAVVIDNVAYAGMGKGSDGISNKDLWITKDGATTWEYKTSYPITTTVWGGGVCNNRLYIIDDSYYIIEYNPETDEWTRKSELPVGRRSVQCIYAVDNKIYFGLGGPSITVYDPSFDNE